MFAVLRLTTTGEDGEGAQGTGFLVDLELQAGAITPVLVTNAHVLEAATEITIHLPASAGPREVLLGDTVKVRLPLEGDRYFAPSDDDIAIVPIGQLLLELADQPCRPFVRYLPVSAFPTDDDLNELDALEQVVFLGFPDGRWDEVNRTPIFRRGITATPTQLQYNGKPQFLLDASVFPGSSGSPVFVTRERTLWSEGGGLVAEHRALFVGLITQSLLRAGRMKVLDITAEIEESLDLGVVTHVSAVVRALEQFCDYAGQPRPLFGPRQS
jgi:hypothetical protein